MERKYIIYNNHPFTLIWHLAFGAFGKKECHGSIRLKRFPRTLVSLMAVRNG